MTDKYDEQAREIVHTALLGVEQQVYFATLTKVAQALREIGQERDEAYKAIDRWKEKLNHFDGYQESFDEICLERDSLKQKLEIAVDFLESISHRGTNVSSPIEWLNDELNSNQNLALKALAKIAEGK